MIRIAHQTQPSFNSCVSTCIAMLTGLPATELTRKFNDRYHENPSLLTGFMTDLGLGWETTDSLNDTLEWDHVYLCTVPSLNIPSVNHQIILDCRENDVVVYDPALGRVNEEGIPRKFYHYDVQWTEGKVYENEFQHQLLGWSIDAKITHAPALGITSPLGAGDHTARRLEWLCATLRKLLQDPNVQSEGIASDMDIATFLEV